MRVVIQRVSKASVTIDSKIKSEIVVGLLVLVGIEGSDSKEDIEWLSGKITRLRIFGDDSVPIAIGSYRNGAMNLSVADIDGEILLISQFTIHANTKKGNRPSFIKAAKPEVAIPLYEQFITQLESDLGKPIQTGTFGADMKVELVNDGPVTIIIDSKNKG